MAAATASEFALGEDQRAVQDLVRRVANERVAQRADGIDRYFRDAKVLQIIEGTNQIQRNIIARSMLGSRRRTA